MDNKKKLVPKREDGQVGIRATLNNMGFSDSQIGYDEKTGTVTLNGKNFMKPEFMDEDAGISYANEKEIRTNLVNFFQGTSNPVVRVSDAFSTAAGKYGLSADALTYGNGVVSIGGKPLDILYIDDEGKSWARQNTVETAAADYAGNVGVMSPTALAKRYEEKYLSNAQNLSNRLFYQKSFSYNPDDDPVYLAYRERYLREGARASQDAMANYAALTGGYGNSAAATAGAQAQQYYSKQLTDTIPELANLAYERYIKKYQTDLSLLDRMINLYDTAYQNAENANQTQRDNANLSAASNVARDYDAWKKAWEETFNRQKYNQAEDDALRDAEKHAMETEKHSLETEALTLSNWQKKIYQEYYQKLLEAELEGSTLDNKLKKKKL